MSTEQQWQCGSSWRVEARRPTGDEQRRHGDERCGRHVLREGGLVRALRQVPHVDRAVHAADEEHAGPTRRPAAAREAPRVRRRVHNRAALRAKRSKAVD